jgi:hypothetical protein
VAVESTDEERTLRFRNRLGHGSSVTAKRKTPAKAALHGHWQIEASSLWDDESLHLFGTAYLKIRPNGFGEFVVGALEADIDWHARDDSSPPCVDFSFEGNDDGEPVSGRGWARCTGDALQAEIFIHRGDRSALTGRKVGRR